MPLPQALSTRNVGWIGTSRGGVPDITAQVWQTFDFATLSGANLNANDHTSDGTWPTPTDTGTALSMSTSGVKALVSTVGGVSTGGGTYGLAMDFGGVAASYVQYNPTSYAANPISYLGAIFLPTLASDGDVEIFYAYDVGRVLYQKNGSTYTLRLNSSAGSSSAITVTANAWSYLSLLFQRNSTCRIRVFNAAGVAVGSEQTITGSNNAQSNPIFGNTNAHVANAGIFYYSNWCINTSGTYPLGP